MNLLQRAAAADPELLERFPAERSRYTGMGGALLFTAAIAFASGTVFAIDFMDVPWPLAIVCGLFWGAGIFNLDRWMLTATRRQSSNWKTFAMALPRLVLALLIGFVIAEPVLLRVFHTEVKDKAGELKEHKHELALAGIEAQFRDVPALEGRVRDLERQLTPEVGSTIESNPRYSTLKTEFTALDEQLQTARTARDRAHGLLRQNRAKLVRTLRTQVREKRLQMQRLRRELQAAEDAKNGEVLKSVTTELALARTRLAGRQTARQAALDRANGRYAPEDTGLMDRVDALGAISWASGSTALYTWMLRLFIIFVDIVPIVFKVAGLMGRKSAAERDEDQREEMLLQASREALQREIKRRYDGEDDRDKAARIESAKIIEITDDRVRKEIAMVKDLQTQTVETQKKIAQEVVDAWAAAAVASIPQIVAAYTAQQQPASGQPHTAGPNGIPVYGPTKVP